MPTHWAAWKHANNCGVLDECYETSVEYATWSKAAEIMYYDSKGIKLEDTHKVGIRGFPYSLEDNRLGRNIDPIDNMAWIWKAQEGRGCDKIT